MPTSDMTATKAHAAGASAFGSTLFGVPLADALADIAVAMGAPAEIERSLAIVFTALIVGAVSWFGTYAAPANKPKG